jgi:FAD/FMN-containing dehydrogenase
MTIDLLRQSLAGEAIAAAEAGFEAAATGLLWNARKTDRRPDIIVHAAGAADVQAAVRYAAANGLTVTARGSGHHWAQVSMPASGIVVDLSRLRAIEIDAAGRTAVVSPGVLNSELAQALGAQDLAFPVGHCDDVAVSGYLLGGGFGWNSGAWGVACHNVLGVEVVLADGRLVHASSVENQDIFWAARGAGPEFFGIVTSYRLRLFPLPRAIRTSAWTYPIGRADEVERWMTAAMRKVPASVEFTAVMSSAPPPLADRVAKVATAIATIFADSDDEAAAIRALVAAEAPQEALDVQLDLPTPFEVLYELMGQFFPRGLRFAADTNWSAQPARLYATLAQEIEAAPSAASFALAVPLPPSPPGPMPDTAFSMVAPVFSCIYAAWPEADDDAANLAWLRQASASLQPVSVGHYIGEADLALAERTPRSFSDAAWSRLQSLQRRHDPAGLFRKPTPARQRRHTALAGSQPQGVA